VDGISYMWFLIGTSGGCGKESEILGSVKFLTNEQTKRFLGLMI
jgi:hypothetical protein